MSSLIIRIGCALYFFAVTTSCTTASAADANRFTYLDEFCNPYYVGVDFPKLTTPQWVGEEGVDAVITLGIDDMRDTAKYEAYLRPILQRLEKIDGRASVSIMTCNVDPRDPQLQAWLAEGVSLETHTIDHPCPLLEGGDFAKAKSTYDRCVDLMCQVPGSRPVAFRFPCCDSQNTPSPRAFAEILNRTTPNGNFLQLSSSVVVLLDENDPQLPRELVIDQAGRQRFAKYVPFKSFVNKVHNYPYPFVIGGLCWEFPIAVPDDWQGQNLLRPKNQQIVEDMKAVIDATVIKKGVVNLVFHPYDWLDNEQFVEIVNYVDHKYGKRVKFLNFAECIERINKHLLAGHPLRAADGSDNGVRLLDVNGDGFLDVVIGNDQARIARVWNTNGLRWDETELPGDNAGTTAPRARFGLLRQNTNAASALVESGDDISVWHFQDGGWIRDTTMQRGLAVNGKPLRLVDENSSDAGVRLRDIDGDGICEIIVANWNVKTVLGWNAAAKSWLQLDGSFSEPIVDAQGRDAGLRFVDLNGDGHDDIVFSNESRFAVSWWDKAAGRFTLARRGNRDTSNELPMIVRNGADNGAWFAEGHMWVQNEHTQQLPDGVDRRSFAQVASAEYSTCSQAPPGNAIPRSSASSDAGNGEAVGVTEPREAEPRASALRGGASQREAAGPKSPQQSLNSMRPRPGFKIELVAAEPLVMDPIALDWGPDGKLWVVEMADYPMGIDDKGTPGGRVRFLEDTDGDGKYDKSTLFLDGVPYPTGVMPWRDGVLVSAAPEAFYAEDTDGDGKADLREPLYRGFGEGNQQHRVNGFTWGLDNWLHIANGDSGGKITSVTTGESVRISGRDLRIHPATGGLQATTGQTQFGRHRDDWGNWFGNNNIVPLRHYVLEDAQLRRNPHLALTGAAVDVDRADNTQIFPISQVISHWVGYTPPRAGETHRFTSACSTSFYRDVLFGPEFASSCFTCEPIHNLVHRRVVQPSGVTFTSRRTDDEQGIEFLASSDSWFRPTTAKTGPDGAVWIVDMYRFVLEHPEWIDDEHEKALDLRAGHERGRIYRMFPTNRTPRPIPKLDEQSTVDLVAALDSPSGWQRDTAQRLLIHRNDTAAVESLERILRGSKNPLARLHALCTLDGVDNVSASLLSTAMQDRHPGVRRHAVRIVQARLPDNESLGELLLHVLNDDDLSVQRQLAYALGDWHDSRAGVLLGGLARRHAENQHLRTAALSSLNAENLAGMLAAVFEGDDAEDATAPLRSGIASFAAATGDAAAVSHLILRLTEAIGDEPTPGDLRLVTHCMQSIRRRNQSERAAKIQLTDAARDALEGTAEFARHLIRDASDESLRLAAIELSSDAIKNADATAAMLTTLINPQESAAIQSAALSGLARLDASDVPARILTHWQQLGPSHRRQSLDILLSRTAWTHALLDSLADGTPSAGQIGAVYRQRMLSLKDKRLRTLAESIFAKSTNADRELILSQYAAAKKLNGVVAAGQKLFVKHCSNCHQAEGVGHAVGPTLSTLTDRSIEFMNTAVLDPNRAVEDKYLSYIVTTYDGLTHLGIIAAETSTAVTLSLEEGKEVNILRSDIEEMISSGKSLMPEGLEKDLSVQDVADISAYVAQLGPEPKKFEGNRPQVVRSDENGVLMLTAANCSIFGSTLVFEQQHQNLGFWQSADDRAEWTIDVPRDAAYMVTLHYACANDTGWDTFVLQVGPIKRVRNVPPTGTWNDYRHMAFRDMELPAGRHQVVLRPHGKPDGYLMDLRAIELRAR